MRIKCQSCKAILECDSALANTVIQCPDCGEDVKVPSVIKVVKREGKKEVVIMQGTQSIFAHFFGIIVSTVGLFLFINCCLSLFTALERITMEDIIARFLGAFFIGFLLLTYFVMIKRTFKYTLTNKRIVVKKGIIFKSETSVNIEDIKGIVIKKSFKDAFFGLDTLCAGSAATAGTEIIIPHIRKANELKTKIDELRDGSFSD